MTTQPQGTAVSSDRRTLRIGATTMVLFLLVGVGSAALFSRPSCRLITPTVAAAPAISDAASVAEDFADPWLTDVVTAIAQVTGETVEIVDVGGASARLAAFGDGLAALGNRVVVLDADLLPRAVVTVRDGFVYGSGSVLYAAVVANRETRQVDAIQPINTDLTALTCVELSLVSTPLAFLRDADAGEVLFLRSDEDGDDPFIEVRDSVVGRRLNVPVTLRVGSAGQHGVRTSGALHPDVVMFTQNVVDDLTSETVVWGIDRVDGRVRFTLSADELRAAVTTDGEFDLRVFRLGDAVILEVMGEETFYFYFNVSVADGALTAATFEQTREPSLAQLESVIGQFKDDEVQAFLVGSVAHPNGDVLLVQSPQHTVMLIVGRSQ